MLYRQRLLLPMLQFRHQQSSISLYEQGEEVTAVYTLIMSNMKMYERHSLHLTAGQASGSFQAVNVKWMLHVTSTANIE